MPLETTPEAEHGSLFKCPGQTPDAIGAAGIDDLIRQAKLVPGSRATVFKSGVGAAVRKGAPAPKIETPNQLKDVLLAAKSVALSTQGASGPIVRRAFEKLGIAEVMAPRVVLVSDMTAPEAVVQGRAELAFTQVSEILDTAGAQLLGPLPADLQTYSAFAVAAGSGAKAQEAVPAFLKALTTPGAKARMLERGLLP